MFNKFSLVAALLNAGLLISSAYVHASAFHTGELLFAQPNWDYSPSAMVDWDGKTKVWWCGEEGGRDVIKYREKSPGGVWSAEIKVLESNRFIPGKAPLSWEGVFVCDPTVTRGSWSYLGAHYSYVMYYTTEHPWSSSVGGQDNRIGLAFSNNGIHWTKYESGPVIDDGLTGTYGTGQSVVWSVSAGAGVRTVYTFVDSIGAIHYYYRESVDGISFGPRSEITQAGLTLNGSPGLSHRSPAIAFAPAAHSGRYYYYMANVCETYADSPYGLAWGTGKGVCVYRIDGNFLFTGTWERVLESGHIKPVEVEPGFLTNLYGNIQDDWPNITLNFGCSGAGDPLSWEICWAQGVAK